MKSFIRWVWLWGLLPLQAYGQSNQPIETTDRFVIAGTELMPGGKETTFTVGVEGSRIYTAYNMEIELPEGLAYAPNAKGSCVAKYTKDGMYYYDDFSEQYSHELSSAIISNGNLWVICISLSNENFEKESGGLFRVLIKASPYARPGNAEIRMFGLNLTTASPVQKYIPEGDLNTGTVTVGNEVSVPVNISATNQYGTCILPFALDALPEGLEAYTVASIEADVLRLTPATSVEAYTPYILYAGNGFSGTLTFKIPDITFDNQNRDLPLDSHEADAAQDAGWNFIGNPFTSYFDMCALGYDYPITIWNGTTYEALNPQDDEYVLHPYQAFFVQKPNTVDEVTFNAAERKTKRQSEAAQEVSIRMRVAKRASNVERSLINLTLSDGETSDKTRVVFNARRRATYETECDAAKFMADGTPQLYTLDEQGVKYAINERPAGNGIVTLGYNAAKAGSYTIDLSRADVGVMLKDKTTGASHDFSKGGYTFTTEAGAFENRFLLVKSHDVTGVNGVFAAGKAVVDVENGTLTVSRADGLTTSVTSASGIAAGTITGNGSMRLQPGIYVVTVGNVSQKIMVK